MTNIEMTLDDIKNVSLGIMKHFHSICQENNINYSLGYGSLIGAVRHKGFIPWDDDLDVIMLREDFEKFCSIYKDNSKYKLFAPQRNNMFAACARLCEMESTYVKTASPLFTEPTGLWIDIFPIDSAADNKDGIEQFHLKRKKMVALYRTIMMRRSSMISWNDYVHDFLTLIKFVAKKILFRQDINKLVRKYCKLCVSFAKPDSEFVCNLSILTYKELYPRSLFKSYMLSSFEDTEFMIVSEYDSLLRSIYGNYLQLPPVEKRVREHNVHKYYWK